MAIGRFLHLLPLAFLSVLALGKEVKPRMAGKSASVSLGYSINGRSLFGRQILSDGCYYGYNPCGDRCIPIGGECCSSDGYYCPFGFYCTVLSGSTCCCETGEVCDYCSGDEIVSSYAPLPESTPAPSTLEPVTSYALSTADYYSWTYYEFTIRWSYTFYYWYYYIATSYVTWSWEYESTTLSISATALAQASSYFASISATLSPSIPASATSLASLYTASATTIRNSSTPSATDLRGPSAPSPTVTPSMGTAPRTSTWSMSMLVFALVMTLPGVLMVCL